MKGFSLQSKSLYRVGLKQAGSATDAKPRPCAGRAEDERKNGAERDRDKELQTAGKSKQWDTASSEESADAELEGARTVTEATFYLRKVT